MTARAAAAPAWRAWLRRHEREIAIGWLMLVAAAMLLLALPPTRAFILDRVQGLSDRWDRRWERRLARGAALVEAQRFGQAAAYLEALDREYPAANVKEARDAEREQVLRLLARAYEGQGKSTKTMRAYDRLIAFDPNNYHSVFLKGQAAERMLSGWAIAPEARDAYAAALKIFPNHLPSLRGYIEYYADRGEFHPIVDAYRAYLDAYLVSSVAVTVGDSTFPVPVPVDGRAHDVAITLPRADAESLVLRAEGYPVAIDSVFVRPSAVVGAGTRRAELPVRSTAISVSGMQAAAHGAWLPAADSAAVVVHLPRGGSVDRVRLVMRLYKPMDRPLWVIVARSFHNLLDDDGRAAAELRTVPFPKDDDADRALMRPWWAKSGLTRVFAAE